MLLGVWLVSTTVLLITPGTTHAGPPAPTATPTETPSTALAAPTEVDFNGVTHTFTWRDNATGEEGYRLVVTIGDSNTRSFEVGPDIEQFQLPADFSPNCTDLAPNLDASVTAFSGASEGPPGTISVTGLCPPGTITPTPSLPITGTEPPAGGGTASFALPATRALLGVLALSAGLLRFATRRT